MSAKLKKLRTAVTLPDRHTKYTKCKSPKRGKRSKGQASRGINQSLYFEKTIPLKIPNFFKEDVRNECKRQDLPTH